MRASQKFEVKSDPQSDMIVDRRPWSLKTATI